MGQAQGLLCYQAWTWTWTWTILRWIGDLNGRDSGRSQRRSPPTVRCDAVRPSDCQGRRPRMVPALRLAGSRMGPVPPPRRTGATGRRLVLSSVRFTVETFRPRSSPTALHVHAMACWLSSSQWRGPLGAPAPCARSGGSYHCRGEGMGRLSRPASAGNASCRVPAWSPALGTGCHDGFGIAFLNN